MDQQSDSSSAPVAETCCVCRKSPAQKCSRCRLKSYCSKSCQASHWSTHKLECVQTHLETVADCFGAYKIYGSCLLSAVILSKRLQQHGIEAFVKDGYCIIDDKYAVRHVWVENVRGVQFDIGYSITMKTYSSDPRAALLGRMKRKLVDQLPDHVERLDNETPDEQRQLREFETGINMLREGEVDTYLSGTTGVFRQIYQELCTPSDVQLTTVHVPHGSSRS